MKRDDEANEDDLLRSVALKNAQSIELARQRAEQALVRARDALHQSQERLTAALHAAGTGTFRWLVPTGAIEWDKSLERLFGLAPGHSIGTLDEFLKKVSPADRPAVSADFTKCAREGCDLNLEFQAIWPDGATHWLQAKGKMVFDSEGRPHYMPGACIEITQHKQIEEALRSSEERLRATLAQAAVGIAEADLNGRFTHMNDRFASLLGYSPEELGEMTFMQLTHPDDRAATQVQVQSLLAGEIPRYGIEKRYVRKDGSVMWSKTTVTLLRDSGGQPVRFIGVIDDITQRKATEEALREAGEERKQLLERERAARAEAERMSASKDEFLATLSHELRTPLSSILGWAQILRRGDSPGADLATGLEAIERNARAQAQLIEGLLDMSRINSGKVRLDTQLVEPLTVVEAALQTVRPSADAKGVRLEAILDPSAGPISGDPNRLQQVVWNLLSNAIKFTPRDGKVQVVLERVNSHIEISVADTGIGIKPQFLSHVFERFRQADSSTTRKYGGLGLGLSIVKNLVELHGGTVEVTSAGENCGTTVTIRLPVG